MKNNFVNSNISFTFVAQKYCEIILLHAQTSLKILHPDGCNLNRKHQGKSHLLRCFSVYEIFNINIIYILPLSYGTGIIYSPKLTAKAQFGPSKSWKVKRLFLRDFFFLLSLCFFSGLVTFLSFFF